MKRVKRLLRDLLVTVLRGLGSTIRDPATGAVLGKAFLFPWRGRILVIGLEERLLPVFLTQHRITYWKQEIAFIAHPPPDFPNERGS